VVDTLLVSPALASIPGFDPATQLVCDREMFKDMCEKLRSALLKLELREQEVARLTTRNTYLEGGLKLQEQHHTNILEGSAQAAARQAAIAGASPAPSGILSAARTDDYRGCGGIACNARCTAAASPAMARR
jgi:hypothetical protein